MTGRREISSRNCEMSQAVTTAQVRMFDLAKRDHGFTLKVLHLETGISESTLRGWIEGKFIMPLDGFVKLAKIKSFPNELLSLPFEDADRTICDADAEETDKDDAAIAALEYALEWARARHPESPSGVRIDHTEKPDIERRGLRLIEKAKKVAAA